MHEDRPLNFPVKALPGRLQFSLSTLLLLMTLACVCLALTVRLPLVGLPLTFLAVVASVRAFAAARYDVRLRNAALVPLAFTLHFVESFAMAVLFAIGSALVAMPIGLGMLMLLAAWGLQIVPLGGMLIAGLAFLTPFGMLVRLTWPPF